MSDEVILTAVGTVQSINKKASGWTEVEVAMPGKQYPLKLATKRDEIIGVVNSLPVGAVATFTYKESDGNPNPHKPGTYYKNRYLEDVELGATPEAQQAASATSAASGAVSQEVWEAKERRDFRSRSWAHTISAFQHTIKIDEDPTETYRRLSPFQRLVYLDIVRNLADNEQEDEPNVPF
jgi:hypothetical protein